MYTTIIQLFAKVCDLLLVCVLSYTLIQIQALFTYVQSLQYHAVIFAKLQLNRICHLIKLKVYRLLSCHHHLSRSRVVDAS